MMSEVVSVYEGGDLTEVDRGSCANVNSISARSTVRTLASMAVVALLVVLIDQLSKVMIVSSLGIGELVPVVDGLFNLTLTYNKGIAFGMLASLPESIRLLVLVGGTLVAGATISVIMFREYRNDRIACIALAGIVGGAIGNLLDRVRLGAVVDFLDVYVGSYHWPAFNIADSAICVGVGILMIRSLGFGTVESNADANQGKGACGCGKGK
jgi:signal peptidase II